MIKISICTQTRDRNSFLLQTVPTWLKSSCDEVVIFDWPDKEKAEDILSVITDPRVKIFENTEVEYYQYGQSTSKNTAIRCCENPLVFYIDADTLLLKSEIPYPSKEHFIQGITITKEGLNKKGFESAFTAGGIDERIFACNFSGSFIIWKKDFLSVNGFDEHMVGWGFDDEDFYTRLIKQGILRETFDENILQHIDHNDQIRTEGYSIKDRGDSWNKNRVSAQIYAWKVSDKQQSYDLKVIDNKSRASIL